MCPEIGATHLETLKVSDQVMGGVSSGEVSVSLEDVTPLVQMTGDVSTSNNGGFIQIRRDVSNLTAQKISGVYLTVKGNGECPRRATRDYFDG